GGLKADQVAVAEALHQLPMIGQGREDLRRRQGGVEEKADRVVQAALAQFLRHQHQVVVVDPDQVVAAHVTSQAIRKELIYLLISLEVAAVVVHQVRAEV